jgi:membrane protein YdbS with pleckstrin-like domain
VLFIPFVGFLQSIIFGVSNNRVQIVTDSSYIAKVVSLYSLLNVSLGFLGAFVLGNIAYFISLLTVYKIFSLFIICFSIFTFFYYKI